MKILYVYEKLPENHQNYLLRLLKQVKKHLNVKTFGYKESELLDFSLKKNITKKVFQKIHNVVQKGEPSTDISTFKKFDILHIQHSYLWKKMIPLLELKKRPKIVITLRGGDTYIKPWTFKRLEEFYARKNNAVDAFVVMTNHQRNYIERWGVSPDKIHVIPISFGDVSNAEPKYPNKAVLKIVSAFRMTWEKNIEGHLRFALVLKERGIPFTYDIYGKGPQLDQLFYLVDQYDLSNNVNVKRAIDNEKLMSALPSYDFLIQLSMSESLGMSVIEAQSKGVPCVISNSGGLPETVIANETAIVHHYHDLEILANECIKLWEDRERYYAFSKRSILNANDKFSTAKEIVALTQLYQNL